LVLYKKLGPLEMESLIHTQIGPSKVDQDQQSAFAESLQDILLAIGTPLSFRGEF
jgi:hypothetical protein